MLKFHGQGKLGFGAPTKRISPRNSTDKASWGSGPQQREFHREIQRAKQVVGNLDNLFKIRHVSTTISYYRYFISLP